MGRVWYASVVVVVLGCLFSSPSYIHVEDSLTSFTEYSKHVMCEGVSLGKGFNQSFFRPVLQYHIFLSCQNVKRWVHFGILWYRVFFITISSCFFVLIYVERSQSEIYGRFDSRWIVLAKFRN